MLLGIAMKRIWTLINTLQVLTHLPLLALPLYYPANFSFFLKTMYDISNVKLIPKAQILQGVMMLYKTSSDSEFLGDVGDLVIGAAVLIIVSGLLFLIY
jgi:hypothetical protein